MRVWETLDSNILVSGKFICQGKEAPVMGEFLCIVLRGNGPEKLQHVPLHNDEICFKIYVKQDIWEQVIENAEPILLKEGLSLTSHMAAVSCWYFYSM